MKVTIDTNFLISSTQWDYSVAHKLLQKLIREDVDIFVTKDILEEFAEVLKRDFKYADDGIQNILDKVMQFVTMISPKNKIMAVKDDTDDDKIIECALESGSEYIISYDKHLLNLTKYKAVKIIRPEDALSLFK